MHYHQYQFIMFWANEYKAKTVLVFNDQMINLPSSIPGSGINRFASEFLGDSFEVEVAGNGYKKTATYQPPKTYDLIIDFRELSIVKKATAYNMMKNMQKAAHKDTVFIHFYPQKGHFPGMHRNSNLTLSFWGELLAENSILEEKLVGAHHNITTGLEVYIAFKKQSRFPGKKQVLELLKEHD